MSSLVRAIFVSFAFFLLLCAPRAKAQELVVNGNFETGDFSGWSTSGTTAAIQNVSPISGLYSASLTSGSISQVIQTEVGASYRVSCSMNAPFFLIAGFGGNLIASGTSTTDILASATGLSTGSTSTVSAYFIADSTTTTITVVSNTIILPGTSVEVDDLSANKLQFSHPGRYTGKVVTTVSFDKLQLDTSRTTNVSGRIDSAGHMFLTSSAGEEWTAIVQDDGSVQMDLVTSSGAKFAAGVLKFTISQTVLSATFGNGTNQNRTEKFVLTRVGP
jgi:hypothetical protein